VKRIPDTFKAEGDVIVPRFTVKLGVPVMVPKAAMSAPSPVVVLSQVVKPAGVPFGATAVFSSDSRGGKGFGRKGKRKGGRRKKPADVGSSQSAARGHPNRAWNQSGGGDGTGHGAGL